MVRNVFVLLAPLAVVAEECQDETCAAKTNLGKESVLLQTESMAKRLSKSAAQEVSAEEEAFKQGLLMTNKEGDIVNEAEDFSNIAFAKAKAGWNYGSMASFTRGPDDHNCGDCDDNDYELRAGLSQVRMQGGDDPEGKCKYLCARFDGCGGFVVSGDYCHFVKRTNCGTAESKAGEVCYTRGAPTTTTTTTTQMPDWPGVATKQVGAFELLEGDAECAPGTEITTAAECQQAMEVLDLDVRVHTDSPAPLVVGNFRSMHGEAEPWSSGWKQPPRHCSYAFAAQFGNTDSNTPFGVTYYNDPSETWGNRIIKHCNSCNREEIGKSGRFNIRCYHEHQDRPEKCRMREERVHYQPICKVSGQTAPVYNPWWEQCQPFSNSERQCGLGYGRCREVDGKQRFCFAQQTGLEGSHCSDVWGDHEISYRHPLSKYFDSQAPNCPSDLTAPALGNYQKQANTLCGKGPACGSDAENALDIYDRGTYTLTYAPGITNRENVDNCKLVCDADPDCMGFAWVKPQHCWFFRNTACSVFESTKGDCYTKEGMQMGTPGADADFELPLAEGGCFRLSKEQCCGHRDGRSHFHGQQCVAAKYTRFGSGNVCEPRSWAQQNQNWNIGRCDNEWH